MISDVVIQIVKQAMGLSGVSSAAPAPASRMPNPAAAPRPMPAPSLKPTIGGQGTLQNGAPMTAPRDVVNATLPSSGMPNRQAGRPMTPPTSSPSSPMPQSPGPTMPTPGLATR